MEIKFEPKSNVDQKGKDDVVVKATTSGFIMVEPLAYPIRMQMKADFVTLQTAETEDIEKIANSMKDRILMIAKMSEKIRPQIKSVDMKCLETGREAKTVDQLFDDPAFDSQISELVVTFVMGFRPN